jgi:D-cysteine desulfhydrase
MRTDAQPAPPRESSSTIGLVLDPVYTGKALFGVAQAVERGEIRGDARVLFLHTGGLPGLLAQGEDLREAL